MRFYTYVYNISYFKPSAMWLHDFKHIIKYVLQCFEFFINPGRRRQPITSVKQGIDQGVI